MAARQRQRVCGGSLFAVKSYGSDKIFSISPAGNIDGNENALFADVELWLSTPGYADYIIPQVYFGFENQSLPFEKTAKRWASVSDGRVGIIWGLAAYKCGLRIKTPGRGAPSGRRTVILSPSAVFRPSAKCLLRIRAFFIFIYVRKNQRKRKKRNAKSRKYVIMYTVLL